MQRAWKTAVKILTGLSFTAMAAMPQAYTISARPGAVNYIEGTVTLNGGPVSTQQLRGVFLNASDTLATESGKAEVLLTPGVFLRLGDKSEVRMVSPSLTDTQVELLRGDAMIEADDLNKDNRITMLNHGASIILLKSGLYRFSANDAPLASVIFGKAQISYGDKKVEIGKGNQALLNEQLTRQKFDAKKEDELFAWSNVRSEYNAASSYQTANNVSGMGFNSYGGSFGGFGPYGNNLVGPGWYWNSGFNSYSWLPGGGGAFFSPFGYGFYGAGLVGYAPVVRVPVGIGGRGPVRVVPVNGNRPPNFMHRDPQWGQRGRFDRSTMSPAAYQAARARAGRAFAQGGGFRNGAGGSAPAFTGRGGGSRSFSRAPGSGAGAGYRGGGGGFRNGGNGGGYRGGAGGGASGGGGGRSGGGGGGGGRGSSGGGGGARGK